MQPTPSQDTPATDLAAQSLWASLRDAIAYVGQDALLRRAAFEQQFHHAAAQGGNLQEW